MRKANEVCDLHNAPAKYTAFVVVANNRAVDIVVNPHKRKVRVVLNDGYNAWLELAPYGMKSPLFLF